MTLNTSTGSSFSTDAIDSSIPSNQAYLSTTSSTSTALGFDISLRACSAGEAFSETGAWVSWVADLEYSITALSTPGGCKACQTAKMYCKGGSDIGPKPGYWRSSNQTDNFIACLNPAACLGYVEPTNNNLGEWFTGYQGILWANWELNYSRTGSNKCAKWPNPIWNAIQLSLILVVVITGLVIIIRSTLNGAFQRKNLQSVYIKILMNHLQLIILAASFEFNWPKRVQKYFDTTEPVADGPSQILSFDWFLDQRSDSGNSNTIRLFYQKMIMYALLPMILWVGSILFWNLYYCKKTSEQKQKKPGRIMSTFIILLFLIHPTIVKYMFENFK